MLTDERHRSPAARHALATGDSPTAEDSLTAELPVRPRRRLLTPASVALLAAVALAGGFLAGVLVEKGQAGSSESGAGAGAFTGRLAAPRGTGGASALGAGGSAAGGAVLAAGGGSTGNAPPGGAAGFGRRSGAGATVGQVAFVHKGTLYVTDAEGNTVKVTTSRASRVTKTVSASVKSIHPGETVLITGSPNAQGVVRAESIRVGGTGGGLGGGGLAALFGGGGGAAGVSGSSRSGGSGAGGQTASGSQAGGEVALFGKGG